ncbi:hypothetical protein A2477_03805 [Candidatus Falkowbacteria bacterium RIFOXYC2_FULL_47_12]|uniref:Gfo/Idh/MocA-like oxidoreductase N-terminal domain-containing protein n=2 Tax=Candidatus Falkowiibacteriota TaxID=1752728 RepID=A0A1F5TQ04_9BACT|nr:MAG: hypothetical protein A2242_04410 [Candidatus Falkowbacteria bacterium RIFOXYA2_FULL_47_9]OGF40601.1 MAG: hypothetical protein A2477_03805 [Candidatus Falkowbacteria bacterium RIFOXYC2_FULL_47_12]
MGKRRIRNLHVNEEYDITGFDIRADRNEEAKNKYGVKVIEHFSKIDPKDFDVIIISTSPDAHGDYIRFALQHKKHFFIEHPVTADGYDDIFKNADKDIIKAPSCTFLHYTPIKMIKQFLDAGRIGKILAFQYHMGQYLPDWHPWEDYRQVYFSKKETSACREMLPFELIWLNWLMASHVTEVSGRIAKISDLDMSADDIVLANVKYKNGILGNIIIDVIARKPFRTLRILGSEGVLEWERADSFIKVYNAVSKLTEFIKVPQGHPQTGYINEEEMYNDEIKTFLQTIQSQTSYPHTFHDNYSLLKILDALEESSKTGRVILL